MEAIKAITFKHVVGLIILICFCTIVYTLGFRQVPESNKEIFIHTIGIVEGVVVSIVSYYYGSSSGSKAKTEMLEEELKKKD